MAIGDIIVGIDIGTSKVSTVVGEVNNFNQIETICCTKSRCSGIVKGKITSEDEIAEIIIDNIDAINQGDERGFESTDAEYLDETDETVDAVNDDTVAIENDVYVALGQKIHVLLLEENKKLVLNADYHNQTNQVPPLVRLLLGKRVGDEVVYNDKTYKIESVL